MSDLEAPVQAEQPPVAPPTAPVVTEEPDPTEGLTDQQAKIDALHQALSAARGQVRDLKPRAQRAGELEQQVSTLKPYADLVMANPQLLEPRQPHQPPPQPAPTDDPELVELARTLELYDPTTGQPDVKRAAKLDKWAERRANTAAQQAIGPVADGSNENRAAANLYSIQQTAKDADGRPLEEQYLLSAVRTITGSMSKGDALRVLADSQVANVIKLTALGLQAANRKAGPAPPSTPPLDVEAPGGGSTFQLSDESRRLAKLAGRAEKDFTEAARRYVPGKANSLE